MHISYRIEYAFSNSLAIYTIDFKTCYFVTTFLSVIPQKNNAEIFDDRKQSFSQILHVTSTNFFSVKF